MHEYRDDSSIVSSDAGVIAEEDSFVTTERLLIDLMIDECAPAVCAARHGEPRPSAFRLAAVVEDRVQRTINRINGHPREELRLAVL